MNRRSAALLAVLALVALLPLARFVVGHHHALYDDAYIYLRYARNAHAGCGIRFNCGDAPVEGFSSPLFYASLVAFTSFVPKYVLASQVVGTGWLAIAIAVSVVAAALTTLPSKELPTGTSQRSPLVIAAAVALVLGPDPYVLVNAVTGLDAAVGATFAVLVFLAIDRGWTMAAAAFAVASVLARPEGLLVVALLPAVPEFRRTDRGRRALVTAFAGVALVVAARYAIFRDVLPNTYWAKAGGTTRHAVLGLDYVVMALADFPVLVLAPLALFDGATRTSSRFGVAVVVGSLAFFLRSGGDTFGYSRLAFPVVPLAAILAARGLAAITGRFVTSSAGVALRTGAPLLLAALGVRAAVSHAIPEQHQFPNVAAWTAVGRYLKAHHPGARIATVPIGAIGFYSELDVIDLVGLTEARIARSGNGVPEDRLTRTWIGHERHDLPYVLERAPDLVVTTKFRETPWVSLDEASAGFWADWLLLRAAKEGRAPYHVEDAPIADGVHWLFLARDPR
ncbi:MAG: hypothetical protein U0169_07705 [Polyangiaceae bacterium]